MKILDVKQGTDEWLHARAGIVTMSELDSLISPEWKMRTGETPTNYLIQKVAEKVLGLPMSEFSGNFQTFAMQQGSIMEHEAVPYFESLHDVDVRRVGFCLMDNGRVGCSPDGLIGDHSGLEVKCPLPDRHLKYLLEGKLPKDYAAQVHGSMYVTGRASWWFMSYNRQFPAFMLEVKRDEEIIAKIDACIKQFNTQFDAAYSRIETMRAAENAARAAAYQAENQP